MAAPKTTNLGLNKVDRTSPSTTTFNTKTLIDDNADLIDAKFGTATDGHKHDGTAGNGPKLGSSAIADGAVGTAALGAKSVTQAKIGDKVVAAAQLADGAATDTVIGSRTISDTVAPTADAGAPTTLFGWLANMIKQITGKTSWRTTPAITLEATKAHVDATAAHGSTSAATAGAIMQRDASGRAKVAAPSAADDIARKDTVDAAIATAASDATTKSSAVQANLTAHIGAGGAVHADVTTTTDGFMIAADKVKLDGIAAGAGTAGSATDSVIGSRTISDTTAPTADAGTPTTLFGWLANMIKQITGKTSWRTAPAITLEAANTRIGDLATLKTTVKTSTVAAVNELFQSASDGKTSVAAAITGMGQAATAVDTFAQLATKIGNISKDASAAVGDVLAGKTFYSGGVKKSGELPIQQGVIGSADGTDADSLFTGSASNAQVGRLDFTVPGGYFPGSFSLHINNLLPQYFRSDVKVGGSKGIQGTMPVRPYYNFPINTASGANGTDLYLRMAPGAYVTTSVLEGNEVWEAKISDPDFIASNIRSGVNIFGVTGTLVEGKRYASGTAAVSAASVITVTGLSFRPRFIIIYDSYFACLALWSELYTKYLSSAELGSGAKYTSSPLSSATVTASGFTISLIFNVSSAAWYAFE